MRAGQSPVPVAERVVSFVLFLLAVSSSVI